MKEFSFLKEKRKNMEYITPIILREFILKKVGKCNIVFDPAVGSGQLLYNLDCDIKLGNDINDKVISYANNNGIITTNEDYILYDDSNIIYDTVVSNYPFSLVPTKIHKDYIENHYFLSQFTNKKKEFVGKLDFIFILKSFLKAERGFFLCFPGIGYRSQELKYRKYLIDNDFVKEIGIIKNAGFEDTNIDILYLELTKKTNHNIKISEYNMKELDFEKFEIINKTDIIQNDYNFSVNNYIKCDDIKNTVDIDYLESLINNEFYNHIKKELELDLTLVRSRMNNTNNIITKLTHMNNLYKYYINEINSRRYDGMEYK